MTDVCRTWEARAAPTPADGCTGPPDRSSGAFAAWDARIKVKVKSSQMETPRETFKSRTGEERGGMGEERPLSRVRDVDAVWPP